MASATLLLKAFNKHFFQFIDDIITIFPDNTDIPKSRDYLETIKTANPLILIKIWHKFIFIPYHAEVAHGNLTFFFEKDYRDDLKQLPNSEKILETIENSVRDPLRKMNPDNMEKCKKHFQLITTLCAQYMEMKK